jgi:hypothetical protein
MTDIPQKIPSTFSFNLGPSTTNPQIINITSRIPKQTIRLRGYRAQFDTPTNALAAKILYLRFGTKQQLLSNVNVIDSNVGSTLIPLALDNSLVTIRDGLDIPLHLVKEIPDTLGVQMLDANLTGVTGLIHLHVIFETEYGSIT